MREKRKAKRLLEEHEVTITIISEDQNLSKEKIFFERSKDISASGARLQGKILLHVDDLVKMDFTLKTLKKQITALGKVKWIKIIIEDESYEAGVEFVNTPTEAIHKIEDYVSLKQKYKTLNPVAVPFWIFAKFNEPEPK